MSQNFAISGFQESVFIVSDAVKSAEFYRDVIGWQVLAESTDDPDLCSFWQLANAQTNANNTVKVAKQILLGAPNTTRGYIRLVEIAGAPQVSIRSNSQIWDCGGIYDVNVRVTNIHELANKLHKHAWFGVNAPVDMQFGPFHVQEWLAKSHDGIVHALIERISPLLESAEQTAVFSAINNASIVVSDHDREYEFFHRVLGFESLIEQSDVFESDVTNVFGMPHNLVSSTPHQLSLLSADGSRDGTVEIVTFPKLKGNDLSHLAQAPNLGIVSLRFPVKNLSAFILHCKKLKVEQIAQTQMHIAPYGFVDVLLVKTPSGNWLEFFEHGNL